MTGAAEWSVCECEELVVAEVEIVVARGSDDTTLVGAEIDAVGIGEDTTDVDGVEGGGKTSPLFRGSGSTGPRADPTT